jgi:hypothetical protein
MEESMHGIIFHEMKKYVVTKLGDHAWDSLLTASGLGFKNYLATGQYPDQEAVLLEDFGAFIVPDLAKVYGGLIKSEWKTLDLLENVEKVIHEVIRRQDPNAKPPRLVCSRPSMGEVHITYTSPRKMCSVAKGIISGLAALYGEKVQTKETTCMHKGDNACNIVVKSAK